MIGILKLNIELQLITTEKEVDEILSDIKTQVAKRCFIDTHRRVLKADVVDLELTDDDIDVIKMLDSRAVGEELPITPPADHISIN